MRQCPSTIVSQTWFSVVTGLKYSYPSMNGPRTGIFRRNLANLCKLMHNVRVGRTLCHQQTLSSFLAVSEWWSMHWCTAYAESSTVQMHDQTQDTGWVATVSLSPLSLSIIRARVFVSMKRRRTVGLNLFRTDICYSNGKQSTFAHWILRTFQSTNSPPTWTPLFQLARGLNRYCTWLTFTSIVSKYRSLKGSRYNSLLSQNYSEANTNRNASMLKYSCDCIVHSAVLTAIVLAWLFDCSKCVVYQQCFQFPQRMVALTCRESHSSHAVSYMLYLTDTANIKRYLRQ